MNNANDENPPLAAPTGSPSLGGKADIKCESCGVFPTWGMARGAWWLTCNCWQTAETGAPDALLMAWKKDSRKRIKAKEKDHS